ncbi:MAG: glutamine synthetase [Myxococcales bacterium]|jgi:glutamine synthetase|nr:glutamine synthetase [Myxococcales bacterium]
MDIPTLREAFRDKDIQKVKVGGYDIDGVLRGKYVSLEKFWSAAESGFGFCDVIFGWDIGDVLYDNAKVTGWDTGYPDTHARVDLDSFRVIPYEPKTAAFLVDFVMPDGSAHPACPRSLLKKVVADAKARGYSATFACELEFWIFKETPESAAAKGYRAMTPLSPGMFGYSWLREGQNAEWVHELWDTLAAYGIPIEGFHTETGPGVYEAALRYQDALRMADNAALFKVATKEILSRRGLMPTFMAKWAADMPGSSGHLHQSLWTDAGKNAFYDASKDGGFSDVARSYLAGQLALMPELTALYAPTVNAYKRYVPGVWAPLTATWGLENRTCAIRAIRGGEKGTRYEYRQTAADINPYVAIATCLASGLHGIDQKLSPPPESRGDASATGSAAALPRTLREAKDRLAQSDAAKRILGEGFVDHYVRTRDWEARQFERAVTEWELRRYFEGI